MSFNQFVVLASSTGLLLKTAGLKVTSIKIDPYMNIDAGLMRPTEHGEIHLGDRRCKS
jgi:CTP synthase